MKIAYISPTFMSDVDLSLIKELRAQADVDYFLQITQHTLRKAAVNIQKIYPHSGVFDASIYPELEQLGIEGVYVINDLGTHLYSFCSYVCYFQLYKRLKNEHYDIIHFTWPLLPPAFILYLLKDKMFMTVHDPFPHSSETHWLMNFSRNIAFRQVSNFFILNRAQKADFIKYYHLEKKHVYESGLSSYNYLQIYNTPPSLKEKYILFFGQVASHKGVEYLLQAFEDIHVVYPNVKLIVAGKWRKGYNLPVAYEQKDYIEIRNAFIPDRDLANLIANCLFVVAPYLDATQSGVVMSAYAFCKPCIATNVGGLPEMVINEKYGLIVPPKDAHAIAAASIRLLSTPSLLEQLSDNIRKDYQEGTKSWKYIASEMLRKYNQ